MNPATLRHYAISAALPRRELDGVEFVQLAGPFDSLPAAQAALPATTVPAHAFGDAFVVEVAGEPPLHDAAVWRQREEVMKPKQSNWELDDVPSTFMATPYEFACRYARMLAPEAEDLRLRAIQTALLDVMRESISNNELSVRDNSTHGRIIVKQQQLGPGWFAVFHIDKDDFLAWAKASGYRLPGEKEHTAQTEKIQAEWSTCGRNTARRVVLLHQLDVLGYTTDAKKGAVLGITAQAVSAHGKAVVNGKSTLQSDPPSLWDALAAPNKKAPKKRSEKNSKNR